MDITLNKQEIEKQCEEFFSLYNRTKGDVYDNLRLFFKLFVDRSMEVVIYSLGMTIDAWPKPRCMVDCRHLLI